MMDAIPWRRRGRRCSSSRWRLPFSFLTLVPCLPTVPISRSLASPRFNRRYAGSGLLSLSVSRRNNPCAESSVLRGGSVSQRRTTGDSISFLFVFLSSRGGNEQGSSRREMKDVGEKKRGEREREEERGFRVFGGGRSKW